MLSRVYIDNYRCFINFEFRPKALQLVLGGNGTGKSAFLKVLRNLRDFALVGYKAPQVFTKESLTRWQTSPQQSFELEVTGNGGKYLYTLWIEVRDDKPQARVIKETLDFNRKPLLRFADGQVQLFDDSHKMNSTYPVDEDRSALANVATRRATSRLEWLKRWLDNLYSFRIDPSKMGAEARQEEDYPEDDLKNFAAWYSHLTQEETGAVFKLQQSLKDVLDGFDSLDLKRAGRSRLLKATFSRSEQPSSKKRQSLEFDFDELSDGQRVLVALYTVLHCAVLPEKTIFIDEPENFVALAEIQPWLLELQDRAEDAGAQVVLVSHHPELINLLAPEHGAIFSRSGIGPVRVQPYHKDTIGKLSPAELVARGWERG
jgi:energy-coupling factor transporter ATP-binding protein EcfA2